MPDPEENPTTPPHARRSRRYDICPRCGHNMLRIDTPQLNALSRTDNETYICSDCGMDEALEAFRNGEPTDSKNRWKAPQQATLKRAR